MSNNEFWRDDPSLFWAYRISFIEKEQRDFENANLKSWLGGLYNFNAFRVVENNLNRPSGATPENYMDKPIDFNGLRSEYEKEQRIIAQKKALEQNLQAWLIKSKHLLEKDKGKS